MRDDRVAAIVPAAGLSQRMGRCKPLIDIGDGPMIRKVLRALRFGGVGRIVVVAPPGDRAESGPIEAEAIEACAEVVVPADQPADMRASVQLGLDRLAARTSPPGALVIAPADVPGINVCTVERLIRFGRTLPGTIVVATAEGKRGHPILLPWSLALTIRDLPEGVGVKALLDEPGLAVFEMPLLHRSLIDDLDTPEDLRRWMDRHRP